MIISILNQKGGVGKTTLAINIARCLTKNNIKTLLVDSDNQGSALSWHEHSNGELIDLTCLCSATFEKDIQKYVDYYDIIIIDGVPRVSPLTISAICCSDLILIPIQPSHLDYWSTEDIIRHIKERQIITNNKLKAAFIVSRKIVNTNIGKDIFSELDKMGLPTLKNGTSQRVSYATSVQKGTTVLDGEYNGYEACKEIENITKEIIEEWKNGAN